MNYFLINIKKLYKNKLNSIPLMIFIIFIILLYYGNFKSATVEFDLDSPVSVVQEINYTSEQIEEFERNMKNFSKDSEEYININNDLNLANERKKHLEIKLKSYRNKDWNKFYESDSRLKKIDTEAVNKYAYEYDDEFLQSIVLNEKYSVYRFQNKLGFDDRFTPIEGISYIIQISNQYLSIILIIIMTFFLSSLYCSDYFDNINISKLIPLTRMKKNFIKLLIGCFIGVVVTIIIFIIAGLMGCIGSEFGNLNSPLLTYSISGINTYEPIGNFIIKWSILIFLAIMFISNIVFIFSYLLKKRMSSFFFSLLFLLMCMWSVTKIAPIFPIAHLIPMTYFNALQVVSGEIQYLTQNSNVNTLIGILILIVFNIFLILFNLYLKNKREVN